MLIPLLCEVEGKPPHTLGKLKMVRVLELEVLDRLEVHDRLEVLSCSL